MLAIYSIYEECTLSDLLPWHGIRSGFQFRHFAELVLVSKIKTIHLEMLCSSSFFMFFLTGTMASVLLHHAITRWAVYLKELFLVNNLLKFPRTTEWIWACCELYSYFGDSMLENVAITHFYAKSFWHLQLHRLCIFLIIHGQQCMHDEIKK